MTTAYFRKGKSNFATTLVTRIGTGTSDTITLNSTAGLHTDTEIVLTFNRVTSSGVVNSTSVMERIKGTISGATLTVYTRGVDGTTEQEHGAGTVVEYIPNAADVNDSVDGLLIQHNADGTHKSALVTTLKASAAEVTAGTEDAKIVTPKALADAGIVLVDEDGMASDSATKVPTQQSVKAYVDATKQSAIEFVIDGGGIAITTGIKGRIEVPYDCTIDTSTVVADQSGSIVIDIWKDTYANLPATDADSITASAPPTLSSATSSTDSTLTGWTTALTKGDWLYFNVDSATTVTNVTLSLKTTRN